MSNDTIGLLYFLPLILILIGIPLPSFVKRLEDAGRIGAAWAVMVSFLVLVVGAFQMVLSVAVTP